MTIELIDQTIVQGKQSVELRSYYNIDNIKIRVEAKKDSYDFQSYARSHFFTDKGWEFVCSIPYQNMDSVVKDLSPYAIELDELEESLAFDEGRVLVLTRKILGLYHEI